MRPAPIIVSIVIVVLVALGIAFEGERRTGGATIGALVPLTGALQVYGQTSLRGIQLAVEEVNAAGGVLGGELTLVTGDTQTNPQNAVDAATRMATTHRLSGIVGALSSGSTIPVASSVTSVQGIPQISNASTSPVITHLADNDFLFRTTPSDALQGAVLADLVAAKGIESAAVIYVNNDYGQGLAEAFGAAFPGTVTQSIAYEEGQASYRSELQRARDGGAETLILIAYPGDGIPILRQSLEEELFTSFVFTDGMKAQEVADAIGGGLLDGAFGTAPSADPDSQPAQAFKALYEARYGELPPQPFIDGAYDAAMLLALAIVKAGTNEPIAVRDALREVAGPPGTTFGPGQFAAAKAALEAGQDIDYAGAAGSQDFDEHGDVPGIYVEWEIRDGRIRDVVLITP